MRIDNREARKTKRVVEERKMRLSWFLVEEANTQSKPKVPNFESITLIMKEI